MTKVITAIATNVYSFCPTDFAYGLCQELGIFQAIWCSSFFLFLCWTTKRNNFYYATSLLYRLSCLVSSFPYFSPPVVNHLLCEVVVELCMVPVVPPLTSLTKLVCINIIHSKDWSINSDTPILGLKLPLQLEIILPCTFALINLWIAGIISFSNPWLIDIKLNTNWVCIGTIIHLYNPVPCIWHTSFQVWGVRNTRPPVFSNPNEGELVQLLLVIESELSLPHTSPCKIYLRKNSIKKSLVSVFTTPMNINPRFLSSSRDFTEVK